MIAEINLDYVKLCDVPVDLSGVYRCKVQGFQRLGL